jgi:methylmalonyl-CoA epimerase
MIQKVSHIGIAVNSIEQASKLYTEVLGLKVTEIETVPDQKVRIAVIPVGDTRIELLEPTDPEGPVGKHIASRGEGLHHIALQVDDIRASLESLQKKEIPLVDKAPRVGAGHALIAFIHPKATKALIELTQPAQ